MKSLFLKTAVAVATLTGLGAILRSISYAASTRDSALYGPSELGAMLAAATAVMFLAFAASAWRAGYTDIRAGQ